MTSSHVFLLGVGCGVLIGASLLFAVLLTAGWRPWPRTGGRR